MLVVYYFTLHLIGTLALPNPNIIFDETGFLTGRETSYKKKNPAVQHVESLQDLENSIGYMYNNNRHEKKDKPESKIYPEEIETFYTFPFMSKHHGGHERDYNIVKNEDTTTYASANVEEISLENLDTFCWEIMTQAIPTCWEIFKDKQRTILNEKCVNARTVDELLACAEYLKTYKTEKDFDNQIGDEDKNGAISTGKRNASPKRLPFHSWGGKRANQVGTEKIQASRVPFNAWGGKRNYAGAIDDLDNMKKICCARMALYKLGYDPYKRYKAKYNNLDAKYMPI